MSDEGDPQAEEAGDDLELAPEAIEDLDAEVDEVLGGGRGDGWPDSKRIC